MNHRRSHNRGRRVIDTKGLIALTLVTICVVAFTISYAITVKVEANKNSKKENVLGNSMIEPETKRYTVVDENTPTPEKTETSIPTAKVAAVKATPLPQQNVTSVPTKNIAGIKSTPGPEQSVTSTPTNNVASVEATAVAEDFVNKVGYVNKSVFTHPTPETNSAIVYTLNEGQTVTVIANVGGWYKLSDGTYVWKTFISFR